MSVYNIISDSDITSEISSCLRNRVLDQKFLYNWKSAELYYKFYEEDPLFRHSNNKEQLNINSFGFKNCFEKKQNMCLISLGCWDSHIENELFKELEKDDEYNVDYIWVDLSKRMLKLSDTKLSKLKTNKKLICADFSSELFINEIFRLTKNYNKRVFTFFSNTFWNINHTNIIDLLYNILNSGEQIWLDVRIRKWNTTKDDMEIFNIHTLNSNNSTFENILWSIFVQNWIPLDNGYFSKVLKKESSLNALKLEFFFNLNKKVVTNLKWQITFLPWERIRCQQIYYYDPVELILFFKEHNFKLIDKEIKWNRWQFLFEKK